MNSGRATFLAGIILGAAVGFSSGHLVLWNHISANPPGRGTDRPHVDQGSLEGPVEPSFAEPDFLPPDLGESVSPLTTALANEPATSEGSADRAESGEAADPRPQRHGSIPSVSPTPLVDEPQPLMISDATPLSQQLPETAQVIRDLISKELGNAPQAQKDVWFESLRDLPKDDVANVLKMWNRFGAPFEGLSATIDGGSPGDAFDPAGPEIDAEEHSASRSEEFHVGRHLARAKFVRLRNIALRETPGFKRQVPILVETNAAAAGRAISGVDVRVDFSQGPHTFTNSTFDWAIEGVGFFVVTDGDSTFFTRAGRWTLDDDRRLVLSGSTPPLRLAGNWQIPAGTVDVQLSPDGVLTVTSGAATEEAQRQELGQIQLARFANSAGLKPEINALFSETAASGPASLAAPQKGGRGSVRQGMLELSNVDAEEEFLAIDDLNALAE